MASPLDLQEQEQLDQLKHFWQQWGTLITLVLTLVLGSFAAWNGWQLWQQRQGAQAAALAEAVTSSLRSGDSAERPFSDLRGSYANTIQAAQAALEIAKAAQQRQDLPAAKAALQWAAQSAGDAGYQDVAKLRLAALLIQEGELEQASALLTQNFSAEFAPLAQDRLGDVFQLQGKTAEAVQAYQRAWNALDPRIQYRALIGYKLNALGINTQ